MRVLYLSRSYSPHDHRFLSAMVDFGYEVFFLRTAPEDPVRELRPMLPSVTLVPWTCWREDCPWQEAAKELEHVLARIQPDLVHAGPIQDGAFLTAKAGFEPLVSMSWGSDLLQEAQDGPGRWKACETLKHSAAFICDCQAVARVAQSLGMDPEKTAIFPWGVDLEHFSPDDGTGSRPGLHAGEEFNILSTRSWEPVYGIPVLLEGFATLVQRVPEARLIMLGDGSQRPFVHDFINQHGLHGRVELAGQVAYGELPAIYSAADVYVSASHSDGSSVSLLEAMACGLPVVVSDIPGNREWVDPGINGWLFADGEPGALADALQDASSNREICERMGAAGRSIAELRADWSKNRAMIQGAYRIAMQGVDGK